MVGGYVIFDFGGINLSTETAVPGIEKILKDTNKPVLVKGVFFQGSIQKPRFVNFTPSGDDVVGEFGITNAGNAIVFRVRSGGRCTIYSPS